MKESKVTEEQNNGPTASNQAIEQARFYLENERWEQAEKALHRAIAENPDDALPRAWLGLTLGQLKRPGDGLREARAAIGLAPEWPYAHFIAGHLLYDDDKFKQAEAAAREALRLSPLYADADALLAQTLWAQGRWQDCLRAAEHGLAIDAAHVGCANLRAMSLTKLRRRDDAAVALDTALAYDPENAVTHANRGWAQLEAGQHRDAMDSFREALRLDPHQDWARQGIVKALKARNPVYRVLLGYFFWMSRLRPQVRTGVIVGAWALRQVLGELADANPGLQPFLRPVFGLYLAFCLLSWTADPLFNLLLRFDPVGRYVLSPKQRRASGGVAACVLVALGGLAAYLVSGTTDVAGVGLFALLAIMPLIAFSNATSQFMRWLLGVLTGVLALVGVAVGIIEGIEHPLSLAVMLGVITLGAGSFLLLDRRR